MIEPSRSPAATPESGDSALLDHAITAWPGWKLLHRRPVLINRAKLFKRMFLEYTF